MYDLINIIDIKLSGMEQLINKWMINNQLIKSSLLSDIQAIKININKYHNKYVNCNYWIKHGECKYGLNCWYLHPTNNNNFNNINKNNSYNNNNRFNKVESKENKQEISEKKINNNNIPEFSNENENSNNNDIQSTKININNSDVLDNLFISYP